MRKNIFDIVSESISLETEVNRINSMVSNERLLYADHRDYTLFAYVDMYCFEDWAYRGHCTDVKDYLRSLNYTQLVRDAKYNEQLFITLIELVYNFWYLANQDLNNDNVNVQWQNNFYLLEKVMRDNLDKYNHKAFIDDNRVLIIEDKPYICV